MPELPITMREAINNWWLNLNRYSGMPARGTVAGSLVVLEHLKNEYILSLDHHRAPGKSQIQGVSGRAVQQIIEQFGETRKFLSEGGRTNRGLAGDIESLLETLKTMQLEHLDPHAREEIISELQSFLVDKVTEYFNQERLKIVFDPNQTTWQIIHNLLSDAHATGKGGAFTEYLIGAKLQLRFPDIVVENKLSSTADAPTARPGDFIIGDTAFHVTIRPTPGHLQRCTENIQHGLKVYLLVPDEFLSGARQNANILASGQIAVESIESFVSQNLDEISSFSKNNIVSGFARFLELYNIRVDAVENDKSLLIEIPHNLTIHHG